MPNHDAGECLHGYVTDCIEGSCPTIFPAALTTASAFNETLFEAVGAAISVEGRALTNLIARNKTGAVKGGTRSHTICWAPDINPFRHPLW